MQRRILFRDCQPPDQPDRNHFAPPMGLRMRRWTGERTLVALQDIRMHRRQAGHRVMGISLILARGRIVLSPTPR